MSPPPLQQLLARWTARLARSRPSSLCQHRACHSSSVQPPLSHVGILSPLSFALPISSSSLFTRPPSASAECSQDLRIGVPFSAGSMQLMAVPKRKVSRSRKGMRNGPKALKPHPLIIKCKNCGRVRLPHFYCCSGDKRI